MRRDSRIHRLYGFTGVRIGLLAVVLIALASSPAAADPDDAAQLLRQRRRGRVTVMPDRRVPAVALRNTAPQGGIIPITPPQPRGKNPPHFPPQYSAADDAEQSWNPVASFLGFLRGLRQAGAR
jgi:hypothetical protein